MSQPKIKKKTFSKKVIKPILASKDIPATQGMIELLQKQTKSAILALDKKMESRFNLVDSQFKQVDSKFLSIDARFKQIDARFDKVDARFNQMDSNFAKLFSEVQRLAISVEEQNRRNIFVLEGYEQLYRRQERLEMRVDEIASKKI